MMNGSAFDNLLREPRRRNPEEIEISPNGMSIDLLREIYRNPAISLSVRMRAAISCLPFETPKLAVTYQASESDFATLLDQRIKRYEEAKKLIEHQPQAVEAKPAMPIAERRFRRI